MVRIASGALKGRVLTVPRHIRATEAKVRRAIFDILGEWVVGARVIDGFSGSGALGLEALSRGAAFVVFVESDPVCIRAIRQNLARVDPAVIAGRWVVESEDALRRLSWFGRREQPFDVVLLDPPYEGDWGKKSLNVVAECATLASAGILCLEHHRRREPPSRVGALAVMKQHRYGETVLSFYRMGSGTPE